MRLSPLFLTLILAGCGLSPMGGATKDTSDTGAAASGVQIPEALDFGPVAVGETATDSIVVRNYTDDAVALLDGELAGDPAFFIDSATNFPMEAAADGEAVITIGFTPNAEQDFAAELELVVQGAEDPFIVSISGVGGAGGGDDGGGDDGGGDDGGGDDGGGGDTVSASPTSIPFGGVHTNEAGVSALVISNNQPSDILVTGLEFSDRSAFTWQASEGESFNLAQVVSAGTSKSIDIYFHPEEERAYSETLTVETDAGDIIVPLSGTGLEPLCEVCDPKLIVTTNGSDAYNMELVGVSPAAGNLILQNASDVDLTLSAVDLNNGSGQGDFAVSGLSPQVIPPRSSITAVVTYQCPSADSPCLEVPDTLFGTGANTLTLTTDDTFQPSYEVGLSALFVF